VAKSLRRSLIGVLIEEILLPENPCTTSPVSLSGQGKQGYESSIEVWGTACGCLSGVHAADGVGSSAGCRLGS